MSTGESVHWRSSRSHICCGACTRLSWAQAARGDAHKCKIVLLQTQTGGEMKRVPFALDACSIRLPRGASRRCTRSPCSLPTSLQALPSVILCPLPASVLSHPHCRGTVEERSKKIARDSRLPHARACIATTLPVRHCVQRDAAVLS